SIGGGSSRKLPAGRQVRSREAQNLNLRALGDGFVLPYYTTSALVFRVVFHYARLYFLWKYWKRMNVAGYNRRYAGVRLDSCRRGGTQRSSSGAATFTRINPEAVGRMLFFHSLQAA
ncbi:unnamed protein product, partial [Amoebophrya sp. A120]